MEKRENIPPSLEIAYKEFVAVLRKWDAYAWLELKKMPQAIAAISSEQSMQHYTEADMEVTSNIKLSDLAEVLWKSLEVGAKEVHRIHDEAYTKDQVKFFVDLYSSAEDLVPVDRLYGTFLHSHYPKVDHPSELLLKLGKPAQVIIVRDGHLTKAVKIYQQAENIITQKIHDIEEAEEEERREARERRAAPDYVRHILGTTRKEVRDLDKDQCVFCGVEVGKRHGKYSYIRLTPKGYKVNEVVLACKTCEAKLKGKTPEEAGRVMNFGRFGNEQ